MRQILGKGDRPAPRGRISRCRQVRGAWRLRPCASFIACLLVLSLASSAEEQVESTLQKAPRADELLEKIERLQAENRAHQAQDAKLDGEARTLHVLQMRKTVFAFMRAIDELVANLVHQQKEGVKRPPGLKRARRLLLEMDRNIPAYIDRLEREATRIRTSLPEAPDESLKDMSIQLQGIDEILDEAYPFFLDHLEHRESLGLEASNVTKKLEKRASERAAMLAGRVQLLSARRREARKAAEVSLDDAALQSAAREADEELDDVASSLWAMSDVMDALGLDTAEYRQALIQSTGEITSDVFDLEVVLGLLDDALEAANRWIDRRAPLILGRAARFVATLVLFWALGRTVGWLALRLANRAEKVSALSRGIIVSTTSRTIIGIGLIVALSQVGVNVTALLTGLGIVGFIVGFALQDTLGNFASGTMILMYTPFDVGDVIEAGGVYGTVDGMSLVSTTILTFDNQRMIVPNSKIWGDVIRNVTAQDIRRVDLEFGFSHDLDVARAEEILMSILNEHHAVLDEPEPLVKVHKLTDVTTRIIVRPWVKREDYWNVYWDVTREAKLRLARESIPLGIHAQSVTVSS